MKLHPLSYLPCALAAAGLASFAILLVHENNAYRANVEKWAERDLAGRTELAADALAEPIAAGDFERVRSFAAERLSPGLRLTAISTRGGVICDTETAFGNHSSRPEVDRARREGTGACIRVSTTTLKRTLYCARRLANGDVVRLALPYEMVSAPLEKTRAAMIFAALTGASGILMVLLFTGRLAARNRELAQERDRQLALLEEMKREAEFRRDFVADVSHEIKTPLTGILGTVEMLEDDEVSADERRQLTEMLRRECERLDSLAHDILALARLEHGTEELRRRFVRTNLAAIASSAVDACRTEAAEAGVKMELESNGNIVCACNAQLIERAMINLLSNAIRHSGAPSVKLTLAQHDSIASIAVEDHGAGIPEAERERIFERFHRVDRSRSVKGTGLGLAIVKHTALLHGGNVKLETPSDGGARFTLSLPLANDNQTT